MKDLQVMQSKKTKSEEEGLVKLKQDNKKNKKQ
jgi:hypothetical protein